ncbi:MAG: secondary thiamine-phosphate synthase enzyme YjbQ, partial [bacterium]
NLPLRFHRFDIGAGCGNIIRAMDSIVVTTRQRNELVDITSQVAELVRKSGLVSGTCLLYVPHTTAGITINESYDPDVACDIIATLNRLVPAGRQYQHTEGNADAHIKSVLVGVSLLIPVENSRLALGRWQGIFFCEFDGPRERRCLVKLIADKK